MANWAKLQEDLTGLPVVKRARHGIHFDKGNGEIVANFSGKPCHYEDKGVWKPIDTTLLLGADGFYGCPHSPVKVHKDGRVKVDKSDYSQFTDLPGSPIGKVDGDRIVRDFPGGYQELFVTEDGFREVITVVKRTFPIEKFLAKQSGTLPSEYKAHAQTAVDANGNEFVITSDTKAFGDWLDGAAYPVTIDPDFTSRPDETASTDTKLSQTAPTTNYGTLNLTEISSWEPASDKQSTLIKFDYSSIPAGSTVSAGNIVLKKNIILGTNSGNAYRLLVDWVESQATWNIRKTGTNWGTAGANGSGTDRYASATDTVTLAATTTFDLASDIQLFINGTNNYGWVLIASDTAKCYAVFHSSSATTESNRPSSSVTYTTAAAGNPHYYYAQL